MHLVVFYGNVTQWETVALLFLPKLNLTELFLSFFPYVWVIKCKVTAKIKLTQMSRIVEPRFSDRKLEQCDQINEMKLGVNISACLKRIFSSANQWQQASFQHFQIKKKMERNKRTRLERTKRGGWTCPWKTGRLVALNPECPRANYSYCWCWFERGKWIISYFRVEKKGSKRPAVQMQQHLFYIFLIQASHSFSKRLSGLFIQSPAWLKRQTTWTRKVVGFATGIHSDKDNHKTTRCSASLLTVVSWPAVPGVSQWKS